MHLVGEDRSVKLLIERDEKSCRRAGLGAHVAVPGRQQIESSRRSRIFGRVIPLGVPTTVRHLEVRARRGDHLAGVERAGVALQLGETCRGPIAAGRQELFDASHPMVGVEVADESDV